MRAPIRSRFNVCLRPVRYYEGTPSPLREPEKTDMVIFRDNSEDIYTGIEWPAGSPEVKKLIGFLQDEMGARNIRFPNTSGIGIKPVSKEGTERLVRKALQYAVDQDRESVTLVNKGNIMKFTEGAFKAWGYELAKREFGAVELDGDPWMIQKNPKTGRDIVVKVAGAISAKTVTQDLARAMDDVQEMTCSKFGEAVVSCMA